MMNNSKWTVLALCALFSGCASIPMGRSAPVHYWRVDTPATIFSTSDIATKSTHAVLLKVSVSELLRSDRLAWMQSPNEVIYAESQRWAEPLRDGVSRVLRETLNEHYTRVEATPVTVVFKPDWRVDVLLEEAWPSRNGEVALVARWWISDADGKILKSNVGHFEQKGWLEGDWRGYVPRLGVLLTDLAKSIASDLSSLDEK
jgi:uncharacterized lipoprotein YmbA